MKTKKTKILAITLALIMSFTLASCGGGTPSAPQGDVTEENSADYPPVFPDDEWVAIDLAGEGITDEHLAEMVTSGEIPRNVHALDLSGNPISDLTPLSGLVNMTALYLWEHEVADITPLGNMTYLEVLHISSDQLSDLSVLSKLTNLHNLTISGSQISDISPLSGLTALEQLSIGYQIRDISPLSGLVNLRQLDIAGNHVTDITPLYGLPNLTNLSWGDAAMGSGPDGAWTAGDTLPDVDLTQLYELTNLNSVHVWWMLTQEQLSGINRALRNTNVWGRVAW